MARIAIDARELGTHATGTGRYLGQLIAAWSAMPDVAAAHEFVLCTPASLDLPEAWRRLRLAVSVGPGGRGTWWEQRTLPRLVADARADVLFAPAYTAPLRSPVPTVVTMHDVSFAAHPEWFGWREGLRRRVLSRLSARRAARVVTVSAFSKDEIVRHLGVPPERVEVIYSGTTVLDAPSQGPREPIVLYVGSIFNRRHVPALIEGFARTARRVPGARLEIVGDNRTLPFQEVDALAAQAGGTIRVRAYIADSDLALLYQTASAFAFLSSYEGFGMTPVEALAAGLPIVVLDTPVAREIYGDAAIYVPEPDPALVATALEQALTDPAERRRVLDAAPSVLGRYSWPACAQRTLEILLRERENRGQGENKR